MIPIRRLRASDGFTLLELLCVMTIILVLASLFLGVAATVLRRVQADKWDNESEVRLDATVAQLRQRFQGQKDFPAVTLETIEARQLVGPLELRFLKDRRVTFTPFSGADPDAKIVLQVKRDRGYLSHAGVETRTKGQLTRPPD